MKFKGLPCDCHELVMIFWVSLHRNCMSLNEGPIASYTKKLTSFLWRHILYYYIKSDILANTLNILTEKCQNMEANISMNFRDTESKVFSDNGRILPFKYMNLGIADQEGHGKQKWLKKWSEKQKSFKNQLQPETEIEVLPFTNS